MPDLVSVLVRLDANVAEINRRLENGDRHGTVHEVDPKKQRVRMRLGGTDDEPFLSPWIPYNQTAGALKFHSPPSKGQQMTFRAPDGDFRQGYAIPLTWSDENKSPSEKGDEHVATFGEFKAEVRGKELTIEVPRIFLKCGGSTFELTGDGLKMAAPDYQFD